MDTGDRHKDWGRDRDVMGGQEGVRSQNLVSELNALGKRKSAGVLCSGVARVDPSGIGRGRVQGRFLLLGGPREGRGWWIQLWG